MVRANYLMFTIMGEWSDTPYGRNEATDEGWEMNHWSILCLTSSLRTFGGNCCAKWKLCPDISGLLVAFLCFHLKVICFYPYEHILLVKYYFCYFNYAVEEKKIISFTCKLTTQESSKGCLY